MDYVQVQKNEIKEILQSADAKLINGSDKPSEVDSFTFDYKVKPVPYPITIKTFEVKKDSNPENYEGYLPTDVKKTLSLPYLADYVANKSEARPYAYLITVPDKAVLNNLKNHGIKIEKLTENQVFNVESYKIKKLEGSKRLNQGHYTNSIEGEFVKGKKEFEAGLVRTSQPLANVIVYLLEPESGDGFLFWNFFDKYLVPQWSRSYNPYPVYRVQEKVDIKSIKTN